MSCIYLEGYPDEQNCFQAAAEAAMGFTPEQLTKFKETEGAIGKGRLEIGKMITPEQFALLPEASQKNFKPKPKKGDKKEI